MKKILFPFEPNNPRYRNAFVYSAKFARNFRAELIMLYVFGLKISDSITRKELDNLIRENWYKAYREIMKLNSFYLTNHARIDNQLKIKFDYRFLHGNLFNEMKNILSTEEIDLVVLPLTDNIEASRKLAEIVQMEAFEKNSTSVLLIPEEYSFQPIKSIVFATDFKKLKQYRFQLNSLLHFAEVFGARIHFLNLSTAARGGLEETSEIYETLVQICSNSVHEFSNLSGKDIERKVCDHVESNAVQLLVLVRHQQHFMPTILHRIHDDEITFRSRVPVMILKEME